MDKTYTIELTGHEMRLLRSAALTRCHLAEEHGDALDKRDFKEFQQLYEKLRRAML